MRYKIVLLFRIHLLDNIHVIVRIKVQTNILVSFCKLVIDIPDLSVIRSMLGSNFSLIPKTFGLSSISQCQLMFRT